MLWALAGWKELCVTYSRQEQIEIVNTLEKKNYYTQAKWILNK